MRLIPLEIGRLTSHSGLLGDRGGPMPIPSWLIEHRQGLVLFDTGLHADLVHDHGKLGQNQKFFTPDFNDGEQLSRRLDSAGFSAADITHVVFSHLHFDHVGGTVELPNARIVVQESEWDAGHQPKLIQYGLYDPTDYDVGHEVELITGAHDVFGDGAIRCLPTPGHTVGHQSLRLELESGPVVLTGDCVYTRNHIETMSVPDFGFDSDQQLESMRELQRLQDDDGCRLLFGHDEEQFRSLPTQGLT